MTLENFTFGDTPTPEAVAGILHDVLSLGELFDVSTSALSNAHDTRPLVVETLLTYLQLDGYLASTGPFYSEYKFQSRQPLEDIFAKFDEQRAGFLRRVFKHARRAKTWSNIDVHATAQSLDEPRERVVAAINYLEEQGDLVLQVAGVRHGYRLLRTPEDLAALTKVMTERFADRESRDIVRLNEVLAFASHDGCKTAKLLTYFGEPMANDCGHCGWCRGHRPGPVPPPSHQTPGDAQRQLIDDLRRENHVALAAPRQVARFLCGIPSPSASRAKLTRHEHYGALDGVPFREVYEFVMDVSRRRDNASRAG